MEIPASKFKATCLELMDRVASTGETITITKHGKVVAKLVPAKRAAKAPPAVGCMKGTILYAAPIEELFSTGATWEADAGG